LDAKMLAELDLFDRFQEAEDQCRAESSRSGWDTTTVLPIYSATDCGSVQSLSLPAHEQGQDGHCTIDLPPPVYLPSSSDLILQAEPYTIYDLPPSWDELADASHDWLRPGMLVASH
ncbi:hypothetical protein HDU91_001643, partial [Kappamyces sp. JEL0680]